MSSFVLLSPTLLERDHSTLTIAWSKPSEPIAHYEIEMSHQIEHENGSREDGSWTVLSSTIKHHTVKKKNILPGIGYKFRVRYENMTGVWSDFSEESEKFYCLTSEFKLMQAPRLVTAESQALTIEWEEIPLATSYRLRFRAENDISWTPIETDIKSNRIRKKGLSPGKSYFFAVIPIVPIMLSKDKEGEEDSSNMEMDSWAYSLSSNAMITLMLSSFWTNLLPKEILRRDPHSKGHSFVKESVADALGGKNIALYFSAHWCPPCRAFTPKLITACNEYNIKVHNNGGATGGHKMEVVFISLDHDENGFQSYFFEDHGGAGAMPWYTLEYDSDKREAIAGYFRVNSIPRLIILNHEGKMVEENAATHMPTAYSFENWATK